MNSRTRFSSIAFALLAVAMLALLALPATRAASPPGVGSKFDRSRHTSPPANTVAANADAQTVERSADSPTTIAGVHDTAVPDSTDYTSVPIASARNKSVSPNDAGTDTDHRRTTDRLKHTGASCNGQPDPVNSGGTRLRC